MNIALLLKSELRRSAGILAGMALIIALALSIAVAAGICERMVKASAAQSADDFDLLIGARGSSSALLLGTVFLRDEMLPIVPASAWANIREAQTAKSSIRWAAPVAFGDRTPSGRTIVGTTRSFLDRGKSREPAAGRFFTKPTEAVAGASSGYVIGDKFSPMHGRVHGAGHAHEGIAYEVVGILPPTGTPWDRAVMVPIESVWQHMQMRTAITIMTTKPRKHMTVSSHPRICLNPGCCPTKHILKNCRAFPLSL